MSGKPAWRIRAHTQAENHRCVMDWNYDGFYVRIRTYNRDAYRIADLVRRAYELGKEEGARQIRSAIYEALEQPK